MLHVVTAKDGPSLPLLEVSISLLNGAASTPVGFSHVMHDVALVAAMATAVEVDVSASGTDAGTIGEAKGPAPEVVGLLAGAPNAGEALALNQVLVVVQTAVAVCSFHGLVDTIIAT